MDVRHLDGSRPKKALSNLAMPMHLAKHKLRLHNQIALETCCSTRSTLDVSVVTSGGATQDGIKS